MQVSMHKMQYIWAKNYLEYLKNTNQVTFLSKNPYFTSPACHFRCYFYQKFVAEYQK